MFQTVFEPMIVIYDLDPYTVYDIEVEATNQFTTRTAEDTLFGVEREFRTLEGGEVCSQYIIFSL